jgi:flagellar biosynthesis protein
VADQPRPSAPDGEGPRPLAIALQHEAGGAMAPRVVAKGRGRLAEQILAIAFDRGVMVRTDADLAEILAAVEVDSEVPLPALAAVAEILIYLYRASEAPAGEAAP